MRRSMVTTVALALLWAQSTAAEERSHKTDPPRATLNVSALETSELIQEGDKYRTGDGVKKDLAKAEAAYTEALQRGDPKGALGLSLLALSYSGDGKSQKNSSKMKLLFEIYFPVLTSSRFVNDPTACLALGLTYAHGLGVPADYRKAARFLIRYADSIQKDTAELDFKTDVAGDLLRVGTYLDDGESADLKLAFQSYERAASLGNVDAFYFVAAMYFKGRGVAKDVVVSAKFMLRGAEQGDAVAQNAVAIMYENGQGVSRDYVQALKWHNLAAANGEQVFIQMRDELEARLSPSQVARAQELASAFVQRRKDNFSKPKRTPEIPNQPNASGTGFFVSADGFFLTNYHVVEKARRILIKTSDGDFPGTVVKIDSANDVAVIRVDGTFSCLPLGTARDVALGDPVITVGYPNIEIQGLAPKLTAGEISSLTGMADDPRVFQISVPIQPGNSGGPLVDQRGNVIGITTAQLSSLRMLKSSGSVPQNVNYAIKISYAQLLLDTIPGLGGKLLKPESSVSERSAVVERTKRATAIVLVWKGSD
jgi:S1-C subfamily serine protease